MLSEYILKHDFQLWSVLRVWIYDFWHCPCCSFILWRQVWRHAKASVSWIPYPWKKEKMHSSIMQESWNVMEPHVLSWLLMRKVKLPPNLTRCHFIAFISFVKYRWSYCWSNDSSIIAMRLHGSLYALSMFLQVYKVMFHTCDVINFILKSAIGCQITLVLHYVLTQLDSQSQQNCSKPLQLKLLIGHVTFVSSKSAAI